MTRPVQQPASTSDARKRAAEQGLVEGSGQRCRPCRLESGPNVHEPSDPQCFWNQGGGDRG